MSMNTYKDFADSDYRMLKRMFDMNITGNAIGALTQNACEKYLKDIIEIHMRPQTADEDRLKKEIMHTHSLRKLERYIEDEMHLTIQDHYKDKIELVDGYYFTTRYPGDESFEMGERDFKNCENALDAALELHEEITGSIRAQELSKSKEQEPRVRGKKR